MTIDLKAIRAAAEADMECPQEEWEVAISEIQSASVITLLDRLEAAEKDAARLDWLLTYFVSDDTSKDDEIIAASEAGIDRIKTLIDAAMKEQK